MEKYKKILVALELNPKTDRFLVAAVKSLVENTGAEVVLVHAVEHIMKYGGAYGIVITGEVEEILLHSAQKEMMKAGEELNVSTERQVVGFGLPEILVAEKAVEIKADLIVVGSHGAKGIQALLGSTANAVLHRAKCDVLVVRAE